MKSREYDRMFEDYTEVFTQIRYPEKELLGDFPKVSSFSATSLLVTKHPGYVVIVYLHRIYIYQYLQTW